MGAPRADDDRRLVLGFAAIRLTDITRAQTTLNR
jgi:hypothetical protein